MKQFEVPSRAYFGAKSRNDILPILNKEGFRRLGIVIDSAIRPLEPFKTYLEKTLPEAGFEVAVVFDSRSDREPDYGYLDQSVEPFRGKNLDAVLGIGGGSALDLAKGIGILLTNPGRAMDYRGMDLVKKPGVPVILFPTTAGTGSEITRTASFVDLEGKKKLGINGRYVNAWAGVLDPELTLGCPTLPTLSAGLDALVHCLESYTATTSSALSRQVAKGAFPMLFNGLPKVIENPSDLEAREQVLLGSHLAAIALWNAAGGGPASGISYPLGVFHSVPHGFAGGILLPYVVRYNVEAGYEGYAPLLSEVDAKWLSGDDGRSTSERFADAFEAMYEAIGAPRDFSRWGVTPEKVPALVADTLENRAANLTHNPVAFERDAVEAILLATAGTPAAAGAAV